MKGLFYTKNRYHSNTGTGKTRSLNDLYRLAIGVRSSCRTNAGLLLYIMTRIANRSWRHRQLNNSDHVPTIR